VTTVHVDEAGAQLLAWRRAVTTARAEGPMAKLATALIGLSDVAGNVVLSPDNLFRLFTVANLQPSAVRNLLADLRTAGLLATVQAEIDMDGHHWGTVRLVVPNPTAAGDE
jgi:hypothetical protein